MEKLEIENMSLEFHVQSLIKEREHVKSEYQKLFDSFKKIQTQTQSKFNELIKHVNQKTYAYAEVRAHHQDLLITISELKAKMKKVEKGLSAASSVRRPLNKDSSLKNNILFNTKKSSEKNTQSESLDTSSAVFRTKIAAVTPLRARNKVIMPRLIAFDHKNVRCYIPTLSGEYGSPLKNPFKQIETRFIHDGRVVNADYDDMVYLNTIFGVIDVDCEGHMLVEFFIQNKFFSYTLEEFGQILRIPSDGQYDDNDEDNEGASRASTSSHISYVHSLSNDVPQVFTNPPHDEQNMQTLFTRQN
ncbi:hypothetical protein Tco_1439862 [Tanacetum coccineum]